MCVQPHYLQQEACERSTKRIYIGIATHLCLHVNPVPEGALSHHMPEQSCCQWSPADATFAHKHDLSLLTRDTAAEAAASVAADER
jgi:hypothetical protein